MQMTRCAQAKRLTIVAEFVETETGNGGGAVDRRSSACSRPSCCEGRQVLLCGL
jgi:hypothetical protein